MGGSLKRRRLLLRDVMLLHVSVGVADLRLLDVGDARLGIQGLDGRVEAEQTGGNALSRRRGNLAGNRDQGGRGENNAGNAGHDASLSVRASSAGGKYPNTAIPNRR